MHRLDEGYSPPGDPPHAALTFVNLYVNIMKLILFHQGRKFAVWAITLNDGTCPAFEFLENLRRNNPASHKNIVATVTRHADTGQIMNERKSRAIEGRRGLFEFKSRQGTGFFISICQAGKQLSPTGSTKARPQRLSTTGRKRLETSI